MRWREHKLSATLVDMEQPMTEKTYTFIDHAGFGPGPWDAEPDKIVWVDEDTGLPCMIHRNFLGALCGYVGIPAEHPWHGMAYNDCTLPEPCEDAWCEHSLEVEVHGGLTYSGMNQPVDENHMGVGIPETKGFWWFGFDCSHACDVTPLLEGVNPRAAYRNVAYVKAEVRHLATQLREKMFTKETL